MFANESKMQRNEIAMTMNLISPAPNNRYETRSASRQSELPRFQTYADTPELRLWATAIRLSHQALARERENATARLV